MPPHTISREPTIYEGSDHGGCAAVFLLDAVNLLPRILTDSFLRGGNLFGVEFERLFCDWRSFLECLLSVNYGGQWDRTISIVWKCPSFWDGSKTVSNCCTLVFFNKFSSSEMKIFWWYLSNFISKRVYYALLKKKVPLSHNRSPK